MTNHLARLLLLAVLVATLPAASLAAVAPGALVTPTLDEVYAQLVDLKSRTLRLEADNRNLKLQVAALATHTHSMGTHVGADGGSMTLRQLKFNLDHNVCMDCEWMYRIGPGHAVENFTGPPKL